MGQKPIEGSNPSLSATRHVNSRRLRSLSRGSHEAGIRTRDMNKGVRQNRRRRFWTTRKRRPKGEGRRPESIPPSPPHGTSIPAVVTMLLLVTSASGINGNGYGALLTFKRDGTLIGPFNDDSRIVDPRGLAVVSSPTRCDWGAFRAAGNRCISSRLCLWSRWKTISRIRDRAEWRERSGPQSFGSRDRAKR